MKKNAGQIADRIERSTLIQASRERVWRALTNADEFGTWFGAKLAGQHFAPGERVRGPITIKDYEHLWFDVIVERMDAPNSFSYRWHPCAGEVAVDYSKEPRTLVTFTLKDAPNNATLLTVVESGFDKIAPDRRLEVFRMNSAGWEVQLANVTRHASA